MWDPYSEFEKIVLDNGLTIYVAHWPNRPWEAMEFVVHCGAKEDPLGLEGAAHFVEHLVGDNIPDLSHQDAEDFFDEHGATARFGQTNYLATKYKFFVGLAELPRALEIYGKMLIESRLENKIEHQRSVITAEFHRAHPSSIVYDFHRKCRKHIFSRHAKLADYYDPLGMLETINKISACDLQKFYDQFYVPENISIVAVGGLTAEEIGNYFLSSPWTQEKDGSRTSMALPGAEVSSPAVTREIFCYSDFMDLEIKPSLTFGAALPGIFSELVITTFSMIVQDILYERIRREKGWVYAVTRYHGFFQDYHEIQFTIPSFQPDALEIIEDEVNSCLKITDRFLGLLEKKKKSRIAGYLLTDASATNLAAYSGSDLGDNQRIITLAEMIEDIQAITIEDMRRLMQYLQPENRLTQLMKP